MANEDRLQALAEELSEATGEGKISWSVLNQDRYQLSLPHGAIDVVSDDEGLVSMHLFDDTGNHVESLEETPVRRPWDAPLRTLFDAARNSALDIDQFLDTIRKDVESAKADTEKADFGKADAEDDIPF